MIFDGDVNFGVKEWLSLSLRGHGGLISGLSFGLSRLLFLLKKGGFNSFGSDRLLVWVDTVFERVLIGRKFGNVWGGGEILS